MQILKSILILVLTVFSAPAKAEPLIIQYGEREVDLVPYYFGFPYAIREINKANKKIYYTKDEPNGISHLYVQEWDVDGLFDINSDKGQKVTNVNIENINFWGRRYNDILGGLVVKADESKREDINLWLFSEEYAESIKLTNTDYIYSFAQSDDHSSVVYMSRYGTSDDQEGCLELLSITDSGGTSSQKLFCDSDQKIEAKLNWWGSLRIDDKNIIFTALADGDRKKQELYKYDRNSGEVSRIATGHGVSWLGVVGDWRNDDQLVYARDKGLYLYDLTTAEDTKLHEFENSFRIGTLYVDDKQYFYAFTKDVGKTTFEVFLIDNGKLSKTDGFVIDMDAGREHSEDETLYIYKTSADTVIDYEVITLDTAGRIERNAFVEGLTTINDELAQCKVSNVKYQYTDVDNGKAELIEIDAYLYEPREPIPVEDRLYVIKAFYGGRNQFTRGFHSLCRVGITTLSPVVRGDSRFGSDFEQLNDGNADAPIRDVIAGARYLQSKYGIKDTRRIGTFGFSHGGWAAVRAISYPGPEHFEFGFALAGAGIYNVLEMADDAPEGRTNIRGWFDKEFGNLDTDRDYLSYLSANSHMDRINAPIFLYHGRNDERITVLHSISFADELRKAAKPHELLIIEEQGHSIRGAKNWHQIYQAMFKFLDNVNADLKSK